MTSRRAAIFFAGFFVALFWLHTLLARALWERDRTLELCLDGGDVLQMFGDEDRDGLGRFLDNAAEAGVAGVAVYWDPGFRLRDRLAEWTPRLPDDMAVTLRPEAAPFTDWQPRWNRVTRPGRSGPPVRHVLFAGPSVLGFPDLGPVSAWMEGVSYRIPWMEFSRQRGLGSLARRFPDRLVRGHTLSEEEIPLADTGRVTARFRRAARERGARFLYLRLFPGLSHRANLAFVTSLAAALRADGWRLGRAEPRWRDWAAPFLPLPTGARQALALVTAVAGPWMGLFWALRRWPPSEAPVRLTVVSLGSALGVAALLSTPEFALGLNVFRGVKAALVLPLVAAVFLLFRSDEIKHFLEEPITVGRLGFGLLALGFLGVYVIRSGHGWMEASGVELNVRSALESVLGVRPRFKEFLVGHPLMMVGFYLRARGEGFRLPGGHRAMAQTLHFLFHDPRPFLLTGFIGQLSIVNTFCHAHTPLAISLARVYHGLWIGALLGALSLHALRWAEPRWHRLP